MSYPILFDASATSWETQGLGTLIDTVECKINEEINGQYELTLEYPKTGRHYSEIGKDSLIVVDSPNDGRQAFRVYEMQKTLRGTTEFYAKHISYDLTGYPVSPFSTLQYGIADALSSLISNAIVNPPFTLTTDKTNTTTAFRVTDIGSIRSWLGGREGSILDRFGGEWHWNNYNCELLNRRGADNGYTIRYGKNLTALKNIINNEKTYTGVVCCYTDADGNTIHSDVRSTGVGNLVNILSVDVTAEYSEQPTVADLNTRADAYITSAGLNSLSETSITLSFLDVVGDFSTIALGDTVTVQTEDLNFTSRVVKSVWNVLLDRYDTLTVGKVTASLSDTIHSVENTADRTGTRNVLKIDSNGWIVNRPLDSDADMTVAERAGYKNPSMMRLLSADKLWLQTTNEHRNIVEGGNNLGIEWIMEAYQQGVVSRSFAELTGNVSGAIPSPKLYIHMTNIDIDGAYRDGQGETTTINVDGNINIVGTLTVNGQVIS